MVQVATELYFYWVDFCEYQMKNSIGKPCEGKLHARFDEGGSDSLVLIITFMVNNFEWTIRLYSTKKVKETLANEEKLDMENEMPKIELHVHIEGATAPQTYFSLAEKNQVKLPCDNLSEWEKYFDFKDFEHFIDVYGMAVSTIKTAEDFALIIEKFYEYQEQDNIIYSEAFLSASFLVQTFKNQEILEAIQFGIQQGESKYKTKINLIPDISRHLPKSQTKVLELAIEGYKKGIFVGLGLGLGGMEVNYPANLFTHTFAKAKEAGLRVVAHAGETVGSESIWEAINDLKVERIGHGIRSVDDEKLIRYLRDNKIPIEVSPTSNYHLGVVNLSEKHPIRKMVDSGLLCTINTDDPAMFSTN